MKFLQCKVFKNTFIGLCQQEEKYYICYGQVGNIKLNFQEQYEDITYRGTNIYKFLEHRNASIEIPFIQKNNSLFHFQSITNKEEYSTILSILEDLL